MPDFLGRKTLAEMRRGVWERLGAVKRTGFVAATGEAAPEIEVTQLYPKDEVDFRLNESIVSHYIDCVINSPSLFADEYVIDVAVDQIEYALPEDMSLLRGAFWKDPSIAQTLVPPSERIPMHAFDEPGEPPFVVNNGAPTYRRQLNLLVLNETPTQDNPGGILVRYIKWPFWLTQDDQVVELQFAQLIQEVAILDAAGDLGESKEKLNMAAEREKQKAWEARLEALVRNSLSPTQINLITPGIPGLRAVR